MIVRNTKFHHPVRFELKRIKTVKVIPRLQFQADPACIDDISVNFKTFKALLVIKINKVER